MVIKAIRDRFSVRRFQDKPLKKDLLDEILEAASLAPSARNIQPCKFVVVKDEEKRKKLTDICKGQKFVAEAPVTIAICATNTDYVMTCGQPAYTVDAAIAGEHIALQAAELGLGTCWIGAFYHDKMAELINLPSDYRIVALMPIGYPDMKRGNRQLKSIQELVVWDNFAKR